MAYSGELDGQKQAAGIMVKYAEAEDPKFPHIIGSQTAHKYHSDSKAVINKFVDEALAKGRPAFSTKVSHTTYSLIYPGQEWVNIERMNKHWEKATVKAEIVGDTITVTTENVNELSLGNLNGKPGFTAMYRCRTVIIDGQKLPAVFALPTGTRESSGPVSSTCILRRAAGIKWSIVDVKDREIRSSAVTTKTPQLCGPIDHAFMSPFVFVRPSSKGLNPATDAWVKDEMTRTIAAWRQVFRGEVEVVDDTSLPENQSLWPNVVLWGDVASNKVIARLAPGLPVKWSANFLELGTQRL